MRRGTEDWHVEVVSHGTPRNMLARFGIPGEVVAAAASTFRPSLDVLTIDHESGALGHLVVEVH